jgi:hypothetical protein
MAAAEEMRAYGITDWVPAIDAARVNRCGPSHVRKLVEHARQHIAGEVQAWGPGAVRRRIISALPGESIEGGWCPKDPEYLAAVGRGSKNSPARLHRVRSASAEQLNELVNRARQLGADYSGLVEAWDAGGSEDPQLFAARHQEQLAEILTMAAR